MIKITNTTEVLNYGKKDQDKLAKLADTTLKIVKSNDLNNIEGTLTNLINNFNNSDKKFKFFKTTPNQESQIMKLVDKLELSYINVLNNVFNIEKISNEINIIVKNLENKIYEANDFISNCGNNHNNIKTLEKKLHDLKLSTIVGQQLIAQLQKIITVDKILVTKIKFSIQNTIPLWRKTNDTCSILQELKVALKDCENNKIEHAKLKEVIDL